MSNIVGALKESLQSVLPITLIVLVLSITIIPLHTGILVLFLFGSMMLVLGMSLFTVGSAISMELLGEGIGKVVKRSKSMLWALWLCLVLGILMTIAEPDLTVLAEQVPSIPNHVLIWSVGIGVGVFLAISQFRIRKNIPLAKLLLVFYVGIMILASQVPDDFIPTAFDSGGVTTGPITVPFIMALGKGMASVNKDKKASDDTFGLVALCSIGPILAVLLLSMFYPTQAELTKTVLPVILDTQGAFMLLTHELPHYAYEVFLAFVPMIGVFVLFQVWTRKYQVRQIVKSSVGFLYTYLGLVLFLTAANVGFMPVGRLMGAGIAGSRYAQLLIPIGMVIGYFVVTAEPAVHTLKKQVAEVTNGAVSQHSIGLALSIGVAFSVGIAMVRVLTGISLLPFLVVGYALSLTISFFVPSIYTGIAFDSGGVASGPMATTFILPFALGACEMLGGNVMRDAFGVVAMIAMTPLITIQVLGLGSSLRHRLRWKRVSEEFLAVEDDIIFFGSEVI
ncbi:MAG: DUF1538 domain-containing protein [Erysipelotrichaceae bacterium]|nr:DUF1538 domain-containing protein [Erysipelotrichaceae bacterium]